MSLGKRFKLKQKKNVLDRFYYDNISWCLKTVIFFGVK